MLTEIDYDFIKAWTLCNGVTCYNPLSDKPIKYNSKTWKTS